MPKTGEGKSTAKSSTTTTKGSDKIDKELVKIMVVQKIGENKETLFGSYSGTVTKQSKEQKWQEILDYAISIGLKHKDDWKYFRDTTWGQNWKARATKRYREKNRTGAGGGEEIELSRLDEAILDVIGRGSAVFVGIPGATESMEGNGDEVADAIGNIPASDNVAANEAVNSQEIDASIATLKPSKAVSKSRNKSVDQRTDHDLIDTVGSDMQALKKRKAELQIEQLELHNYKTRLEIMKLEKEAGILGNRYPVDMPRKDITMMQYDYEPEPDDNDFFGNPPY